LTSILYSRMQDITGFGHAFIKLSSRSNCIRSLGSWMLKKAMLPAALLASPVLAQDWNYFGDCFSDDAILAVNGTWFYPCFGTPQSCSKPWIYGGKYSTIATGVIQIKHSGQNTSSTYTHRSLLSAKCRR